MFFFASDEALTVHCEKAMDKKPPKDIQIMKPMKTSPHRIGLALALAAAFALPAAAQTLTITGTKTDGNTFSRQINANETRLVLLGRNHLTSLTLPEGLSNLKEMNLEHNRLSTAILVWRVCACLKTCLLEVSVFKVSQSRRLPFMSQGPENRLCRRQLGNLLGAGNWRLSGLRAGCGFFGDQASCKARAIWMASGKIWTRRSCFSA